MSPSPAALTQVPTHGRALERLAGACGLFILLACAACSTGGEPVTRGEACGNLSDLCRDLLPEDPCQDADAGLTESRLLCLANAGSCDEILVCEGLLGRLDGMDAGEAPAAEGTPDAGDAGGADGRTPF